MSGKRKNKAKLLGMGLDCQDGEVRVTNSENFLLVGGSHDTHECMQDKCIKFDEIIGARGKRIEELERQELMDVAAECDMPIASMRPRRE
ncbi:MAG: hypothetical protein QGH94_05015 [Phycisphaerae bacterium]|nr:hypothetical protein [Phycisphaerae bacterium]